MPRALGGSRTGHSPRAGRGSDARTWPPAGHLKPARNRQGTARTGSDDQARPRTGAGCDPDQVGPAERDTTFGRIPRAAPLMQKNRRPEPGHCVWPVPVSQQDQVIQWIGTSQDLVPKPMRTPNAVIVLWVADIVRPQIPQPDWNGPWRRACNPIGPIQQPGDAMSSLRGCPVAFLLVP